MDHLPLRNWQAGNCPPIYLAADARYAQTSYTDDQVWRLRLGTGDSPAQAWQTKYGARANLVSVVPMLHLNGNIIYQAQAYHVMPTVTHVAPGYVAITSQPQEGVEMRAVQWAMSSNAIGGVYNIENKTQATIKGRLELYTHVIVKEREQRPRLITLPNEPKRPLVALGEIGNLYPTLMMSHTSTATKGASRIGFDFTLAPKKVAAVSWVLVSATDELTSARSCLGWLLHKFGQHLEIINYHSEALPGISLGDKELDAMVELSALRVVQAVVDRGDDKPALIAHRLPEYGWSANGTGSDYPHSWHSLDPFLLYLTAPVLATIAPHTAYELAVRYISTMSIRGLMNMYPSNVNPYHEGNIPCPPLLAQIFWRIYKNAPNIHYVKEYGGSLFDNAHAWGLADADKDGAPEYHLSEQFGYPFFPTFSTQAWGQGIDVRTVETPDLLALLIREFEAIEQLARAENDTPRIEKAQAWSNHLKDRLKTFWDGTRYTYRDRDTHASTTSTTLLDNAPGDVEHNIRYTMPAPARVVVTIEGGVSHTPNATVTLNGIDKDGMPIEEVLPPKAFRWQGRRGFATTQAVFAQLDRVKADGLSRVYKLDVRTPDLTALDINALMPLIAVQDHRAELSATLKDKAHFWHKNGISMLSAQNTPADPSTPNGVDGVWLYWNTRLGEALLAQGDAKAVNILLRNILNVQASVYKATGAFSQYYHTDESKGLGEVDHLLGIAPLALIFEALGVWILSYERVRVSPFFAWHHTITLKQHGVTVKRNAKSLRVKFRSGHTVTLEGNDWEPHVIKDPNGKERKPPVVTHIVMPTLPPLTPPKTRVNILIEHED